MRGRGLSLHGPVNSVEAGGHRSELEVVLAPRSEFKVFVTFVYCYCWSDKS